MQQPWVIGSMILGSLAVGRNPAAASTAAAILCHDASPTAPGGVCELAGRAVTPMRAELLPFLRVVCRFGFLLEFRHGDIMPLPSLFSTVRRAFR